MSSKIILENIKIYAFHGVLPEEKILGTYYILNIKIKTNLWKAAETDYLKDTLNYAEVNDIVHAEMKIPSELLEHVARRIIYKIGVRFPEITSVKVKITKTKPPMPGEMDGVSVLLKKNFKK